MKHENIHYIQLENVFSLSEKIHYDQEHYGNKQNQSKHHHLQYHQQQKYQKRFNNSSSSDTSQPFTKKNKCTIYKFMKDLLKKKLTNPTVEHERKKVGCSQQDEDEEERYIEVIKKIYFLSSFFFLAFKSFSSKM